jgi:hypothetical protein
LTQLRRSDLKNDPLGRHERTKNQNEGLMAEFREGFVLQKIHSFFSAVRISEAELTCPKTLLFDYQSSTDSDVVDHLINFGRCWTGSAAAFRQTQHPRPIDIVDSNDDLFELKETSIW